MRVRNLAFVIWMLGWPLVRYLGVWLQAVEPMTNDKATIWFIIWVAVGALLYEKRVK